MGLTELRKDLLANHRAIREQLTDIAAELALIEKDYNSTSVKINYWNTQKKIWQEETKGIENLDTLHRFREAQIEANLERYGSLLKHIKDKKKEFKIIRGKERAAYAAYQRVIKL
jgi:hypothetical protein